MWEKIEEADLAKYKVCLAESHEGTVTGRMACNAPDVRTSAQLDEKLRGGDRLGLFYDDPSYVFQRWCGV